MKQEKISCSRENVLRILENGGYFVALDRIFPNRKKYSLGTLSSNGFVRLFSYDPNLSDIGCSGFFPFEYISCQLDFRDFLEEKGIQYTISGKEKAIKSLEKYSFKIGDLIKRLRQ